LSQEILHSHISTVAAHAQQPGSQMNALNHKNLMSLISMKECHRDDIRACAQHCGNCGSFLPLWLGARSVRRVGAEEMGVFE